MTPLRCLIFSAMPRHRPVTANDVMNRIHPKPQGVGARDIAANLWRMADGKTITTERVEQTNIYCRIG